VHVVTQNVDGLHERAGTPDVIRLHGSLFTLRCTSEGSEREERSPELGALPPRCACGALLRPGIVWFGEALDGATLRAAAASAASASVVLVVGTSGLVHPAAGLPEIARAAGAYVVEVNPEETPISRIAHARLAGSAGAILPPLLEQALAALALERA
jgi:NAD-dependent deacetylase